jgi:hypothetical protein
MATVSAIDRRRALVVAEAVLAEAQLTGVELARGLALWDLAGWGSSGPVPAIVPAGPAVPAVAAVGAGAAAAAAAGAGDGRPPSGGSRALAEVLEGATPDEQRRTNGLHVTPAWLADHLVERALDGLAPPFDDLALCDPACGGGAFLLAGAQALHAVGVARTTVVRELVWGADVDPVGLATAEAALALWAGEAPPPGRLVVGDALVGGPALWPDRPACGFGAVVGNPPFLNQLGRATVRTAAETVQLRSRFGDAVRAYTDAAWLFLLLGCELVRPGGRVALVEPLSVVAARDASSIRLALHGRARLRDLWVEDGPTFAAAVKVCAPVLEVLEAVEVLGAVEAPASAPEGTEDPPDRVWAGRLADAIGVPPVDIGEAGPRLGDIAEVTAGFRDEYYGLVPLVREAGPDDTAAPLITAGILDWGRSRWSERITRFAKRTWQAPVVDAGLLDRLDPDERTPIVRAGVRWVERHRRPKVVVASQTRVVEAAVDERGTWVPSVPVVAVLPTAPGDDADPLDAVWRIAAAVAAPAATAWLFRRAPGTALGRTALKVAARDLTALPLPADDAAWAAATAALRAWSAAPSADALAAFVDAATTMYGSPPDLVAWWRSRLDAP